jgi:peptidyl-prolyl cis-trans isomerase B (cyclophilin B)
MQPRTDTRRRPSDRPRRLLAVGVICLMLGVVGCRGKSDEAPGGSRPAQSGPAPHAQQVDLEHPVVRIETNRGAIVVELDAVQAPGTVQNFLNYVTDEFYDGTLFHYVAANQMIVGGGYSTDNQPKPVRTPIRNEAHNGLKNIRGTVAMARDATRIDSATSQFFINLADAPKLDHAGDSADKYGYCVFGKVTEGLDVADLISRSATQDLGGDLVQAPNPPVVIKSIRVVM